MCSFSVHTVNETGIINYHITRSPVRVQTCELLHKSDDRGLHTNSYNCFLEETMTIFHFIHLEDLPGGAYHLARIHL